MSGYADRRNILSIFLGILIITSILFVAISASATPASAAPPGCDDFNGWSIYADGSDEDSKDTIVNAALNLDVEISQDSYTDSTYYILEKDTSSWFGGPNYETLATVGSSTTVTITRSKLEDLKSKDGSVDLGIHAATAGYLCSDEKSSGDDFTIGPHTSSVLLGANDPIPSEIAEGESFSLKVAGWSAKDSLKISVKDSNLLFNPVYGSFTVYPEGKKGYFERELSITPSEHESAGNTAKIFATAGGINNLGGKYPIDILKNQPPEFDWLSVSPDPAEEGQLIEFDGSVSDPEGDSMTLNVKQKSGLDAEDPSVYIGGSQIEGNAIAPEVTPGTSKEVSLEFSLSDGKSTVTRTETVEIENSQASIVDVRQPSGTYYPSDTVEAEVTVRNDGERPDDFYVGLSVKADGGSKWRDNGGTTHKEVYLTSGDSETVTLSWNVEPGSPYDEYDTIIQLWEKGSTDPGAELSQMLDEQEATDVFTVAEERGSISVSSSPDGANVYLDGNKVGTTPWSGKRPVTESYDIKVNKNGYKAKTASGVSPSADKSFNLKPKKGSISVSSSPDGANVYLDGNKVGTTPWSGKRPVTESYDIKVNKNGYKAKTASGVSPSADKSFNLKPKQDTISIDSNPSGGEVYIDGNYVGDTPIEKRRPVTDTYDVRVEFDNYETVRFDSLKPPASRTADPSAEKAEISVTSTPENADVYLDGSRVGTTPWSEQRPVTESYDIEVNKDGYNSETRSGVSPPANVQLDLDQKRTKDPANFDVSIDSTNSPVTEGETLRIDATVRNTGDESGTQTIEANVLGVGSDTQRVNGLAGGSSRGVEFNIPTSTGDADEYTVEVISEDDTATRGISVDPQQGDPSCEPGDANGDGRVTSGDATLVERHVVGLQADIDTECADINDDGRVTTGDATLILRKVVGLE
jgi:hypothetical protein